jgi:hypothetical protein
MGLFVKTILIALLMYSSSAVQTYAALNAINISVKWDSIRSMASRQLNDQMADGEFAEADSPDASFTFVSSRPRTQQNLRNFVARTPDPAARASLSQTFASQPDLMEAIGAAMRGYGFDPHNVADAYAVWWINVWGASRKTNIEPDAATVEAVKRQVRSAFAATPGFADTSDAERQEYAEALLLQAVILSDAYEQLKSDPAGLEQLAQVARKGAEASGLDLSKMALTPDGFKLASD